VAIFLLTFLPQFVSSDSGPATALGYALAFAAVYLAWFSLYVAIIERFGRWLRTDRVRARIPRITGVLLIGFGVRLAASSSAIAAGGLFTLG
jgi:threonine/homoserine/homoserine lactone efflux protein